MQQTRETWKKIGHVAAVGGEADMGADAVLFQFRCFFHGALIIPRGAAGYGFLVFRQCPIGRRISGFIQRADHIQPDHGDVG